MPTAEEVFPDPPSDTTERVAATRSLLNASESVQPLPRAADVFPDRVDGQAGASVGPVADEMVDRSSIGRVLDAFGEGAKHGWGTDGILLSPDAEKAMRDAGLYKREDDFLLSPVRTFNEAILRPLAAGVDVFIRGGSAVAYGTANTIGQVAQEFGVSKTQARRLVRDSLILMDTVGVVTGTGIVPRIRSPKDGVSRVRKNTQNLERYGADLEADRPIPQDATELYPDTSPVIDEAGNINLNRINAPEDVKEVIRMAAEKADGFPEARRGEISLADTEALADALGMTPEQLVKRNVGQAFNAEEITAARNLLVQSANDVREKAAKAAGGTDADVVAFQSAMTKHMAVQEQVAGLTAEAGRALSAFRITAQQARSAEALSEIIESAGGRGDIEDIARRVMEFNSPEQISKFAMDARKATVPDMLVEWWINGLLSGPKTHMTNILSNALIAFWDIPETIIASGVSAARLRTGADETRLGESAARLFGIGQGALEGIRVGAKSYIKENPKYGLSKIEQRTQRAIPSKKITVFGKEIEVGGKQVRIPGRLLLAEDEFFKAIGYRQELNALAYAEAVRTVKNPRNMRDVSRRMFELIENPTPEMVKAARANADYQTFTKELGTFGKAIQQATNAHPSAKLIVPFVRTPLNIFKYTGERTALSIFSSEVRKTLRGERGARAADEQVARIVLGSAVSTGVIHLAAQGLITGSGPSDPRERSVMYASGWMPNSVRIGEMMYSYGRLEPLGTLLGISASAYEISLKMSQPEADDISAMILAAASQNVVDKTWLQNVAGLIEAIQDPERYGDAFIKKLAGSVVPTFVAEITRNQDPVLRQAETLIESIQARLPIVSRGVLPRRDIWGEEIVLGGGLGPDAISPVYERRLTNDPVTTELISLGLWPARLRKTINGVDLTPEQYDEYQIVAGKLAKMRLDAIVGSEGWYQAPPFARRDVIDKTITSSRDAAKKMITMKYPQIMVDAYNEKVKDIMGVPAITSE